MRWLVYVISNSHFPDAVPLDDSRVCSQVGVNCSSLPRRSHSGPARPVFLSERIEWPTSTASGRIKTHLSSRSEQRYGHPVRCRSGVDGSIVNSLLSGIDVCQTIAPTRTRSPEHVAASLTRWRIRCFTYSRIAVLQASCATSTAPPHVFAGQPGCGLYRKRCLVALESLILAVRFSTSVQPGRAHAWLSSACRWCRSLSPQAYCFFDENMHRTFSLPAIVSGRDRAHHGGACGR